MTRNLRVVSFVSAALLLPTIGWQFISYYSSSGNLKYDITDLGEVAPCDINNLGQVVGFSIPNADEIRPFLWDLEKGMTRLETLGGGNGWAWEISDTGLIAGWVDDASGNSNAVIWNDEGEIETMDSGEMKKSIGFGINDLGTAVGLAINRDGTSQVFLMDATAALRVPSRFPHVDGHARDINNRGQVLVTWGDSEGKRHQSLWTEGDDPLEIVTDLKIDPAALNDVEQVAGDIYLYPRTYCAFIWDVTHGLRNLTLDWRGNSRASGINDHGQVVGLLEKPTITSFRQLKGFIAHSFDSVFGTDFSVKLAKNWEKGFLWDDGKLYDLSEIVSSSSPDWEMIWGASDINNRGQIVAQGEIDGEIHGVLLTPIEESVNPASKVPNEASESE